MKNNADAIIFHTAICAENVTNSSYHRAEFEILLVSSNVNVLGMED